MEAPLNGIRVLDFGLAAVVRQVTGRGGPRQITDCAASIARDGSPMLRNAGILCTSRP